MQETTYEFMHAVNVFDHLCITTNGVMKPHSGKAVMGGGIAEIARVNFRGIDEVLGKSLMEHGNYPAFLGLYDRVNHSFIRADDPRAASPATSICRLWSFPTKHDWRELSDLRLITASAKLLYWELWNRPNWLTRFTQVAIPKPGCGLGGLKWEDVKPVLSKILPDQFYIIDRPP